MKTVVISGSKSGRESVPPFVDWFVDWSSSKVHPVTVDKIVSREPEILQAISELEKATRIAISRRINLSAPVVDYLCIRLRNDNYISGNHLLGFKLTPKGEKQLERLTVKRKKKGKPLPGKAAI